jgi:hypothetical protein
VAPEPSKRLGGQGTKFAPVAANWRQSGPDSNDGPNGAIRKAVLNANSVNTESSEHLGSGQDPRELHEATQWTPESNGQMLVRALGYRVW